MPWQKGEIGLVEMLDRGDKKVLVMSFETKKGRKAILDKAIKYFVDEVGLKIAEQKPCCVTFNGDKVGYVTVTLTQEDNKFEVGIETREFEHWVKKFVKEFK